MVVKSKTYTKNCPDCGAEQSYGRKDHLTSAIRGNWKCKSCSNHDNNFKGRYNTIPFTWFSIKMKSGISRGYQWDLTIEDIWNKLAKVVAEVNSRYFHFDLTGFYEPIQLGIYTAEDKGHYDWHVDMFISNTNAPRKLSMVLMLSDPSEFEGGELLLKSDSDEYRSLSLAKGRAWFFPSYMLHKVTPVTKGTRKTLVLWVGGPQFK